MKLRSTEYSTGESCSTSPSSPPPHPAPPSPRPLSFLPPILNTVKPHNKEEKKANAAKRIQARALQASASLLSSYPPDWGWVEGILARATAAHPAELIR